MKLDAYLDLLPTLQQIPGRAAWLHYDTEADVLYIQFVSAAEATDSELTDEDVVIRYREDEIIGYTILHASQRLTYP